MEKVRYGKWVIWMAITVLLNLLADSVIAQPEFISVDCGAKENHSDENNIKWVTDDNYIDVGDTEDTGNVTLPSYLQRLRFFPKPLNKSCYRFPVAPNVPYLLRLWFAAGNYSRFYGYYFRHTIETLGTLISTHAVLYSDAYLHEGIYVSSGTVLYICLIRTSDTDDPFINAIELRTLQKGMYSQAKSGTMLYLQSRVNVGGNSIVRYPRDKFDRIWPSYLNLTESSRVRYVSSEEPISTKNTKNLPPTAVMQTAWVIYNDDFQMNVRTAPWAKSLLLLYLAEIESLKTSEPRSFYVRINTENPSEAISLVRNYSALELIFISNETDKFSFHLVKNPNSTSRPIINAFEYYTIHPTGTATSSEDIEALDAIKSKYAIKGWISDPCYITPWNGLGCVNSSMANRISEINLSRWNLTGSVAEEIGQLTALVNVSLDNNHLIGSLPNLSSLTILERLHLQDNNLSGSVPDWLFKLENLKELFIQNNNFSGVIPAQVLDKATLNVKFSGNKYLCIYKAGGCVEETQETRSNSKSVILGITLSGCLIISLFMAGIALYWRNSKERERISKGYAMRLSQLTRSRAFKESEIMQATQNFQRKIGQGGSGTVFFGELPEGQHVAVKVFPSFQQCESEAEVVSKAQNKNLVSLLGYCSESKNLMLIYEHMSGGSLWDSLHGDSNLNWKTRLKIALDVAEGLEFLHVGCTPKIIHRDVKSANILLDNNMNAKLADFGTSRIMKDGQASHAITAMIKGTPGYIDPEYHRTHQVTDKSDVYSFGVVLFELISGRAVTNASDEEEFKLVEWVTQYVNVENIGTGFIDEKLAGNNNKESIVRVAKLALKCVEDKPSDRPSIREVVTVIKETIIHKNKINGQFPVSEVNSGKSNDSSNLFPMEIQGIQDDECRLNDNNSSN